jgi:tetratricopeptide (TPR) repeat protein
VLGFRNLHGTPDKEWLSEALSQMLSTELAAGGQLRIIPGEDISRVKRELSLKPGESLSNTTLRHLQSEPGADLVVVGAYTSVFDHGKDRLRLDLQLQDTASGAMVTERAFTEDEDRLFDLASAAGARLRQALQVQVSSDDEQGVRTALPANQFATRLYTAGREKLWGDDWVHARDLLVQAVKADPAFPLTHAALSEAWGHLGYRVKSISEARQAVQLSKGLPQEDALAMQARYRQSINDWQKAADDYQMLFTLFPDRVDYGLHLAYAQMNINRRVSLQTINALRKLPAPLSNDPRIDIAESAAWMNDDLHLARAAAERSVEKAKAQGSNGLMTVGYGMMCQSGGSVSFQQAKADCEKARQGYAAAGDRNNAARTLNDLAGFYYGAGDLSGAASMWKLAEQDFQNVGDVQGMSAAANNLGDVAMLEGDLSTAEKYLKKSVPGYEQIGDKDGIARATIDLGELALHQGMLSVAETNYRQAIKLATKISDKDAQASATAGLGDVLTEQDNLADARKTYLQALDLAKNTGDAHLEQDLKIKLARVSIEEGRNHEMLLALRSLKKQCSADHNSDGALATGILLSRALVADTHNGDLAQRETNELQPFVQQNQNRLLKEEWSLQVARTQLASGLSDQARRGIERVVQEAEKHGYAPLGMNAKLARLEWKQSTAGSCPLNELKELERAARSHGLALIARRAALCPPRGRASGR